MRIVKTKISDFSQIFIGAFVLKLDHSLKSYGHPDLDNFWLNLKFFFQKSYHLQKMQKNFRIQFSSFESSRKPSWFFNVSFEKIITLK